MNDVNLEARGLMLAVHKIAEGYSRFEIYRAAKIGLSVSEIRCLRVFSGVRYLTIKELAATMGLAKSRVVKLVNKLEERGLMERIDDPRDGRICLIGLTKAGRNKLKEIEMCCQENQQTLCGKLGDYDVKELTASLGKLAEIFNNTENWNISRTREV